MAITAGEPPDHLRRAAGIRSLRLGDTKVSFVPDGSIQGRPRAWLPDTTDETWAPRPEYLDDAGYLVASVGGLLIERGDRALLIDTGFGPRSVPADPATPNGAMRGGALLDSLARLGRTPDRVDAVAFSHLHPDHLGWAALPAPGTDRPAFAHVPHLVAAPEWAEHAPRATGDAPDELTAALAPRVRTVTDGQEIFPGVRVRVTGGHTPGHAEFVITAGTTRLIAFGDSLHSPIQVEHPAWSCVYDHDPAQAAEHRRRLVAELAEPGTVGFGLHFADAVFGQVRRDGDGHTWHPLEAQYPEAPGERETSNPSTPSSRS